MSSALKEKLLKKVMDTYGYGFYDSTQISKNKKKKNTSPIYSAIIFLFQKSNETMNSLLEMTWEQIEFLSSGIGWNENEKSKKGQRINKNEEFRDEISDEEALKIAKSVLPKEER